MTPNTLDILMVEDNPADVRLAQEAFKALKGPIQMVTAPHTPVPFAPSLEDLYIPTAKSIVEAVHRTKSN